MVVVAMWYVMLTLLIDEPMRPVWTIPRDIETAQPIGTMKMTELISHHIWQVDLENYILA